MDMSAGDFLALFYLLKVPVQVIDLKVFLFSFLIVSFNYLLYSIKSNIDTPNLKKVHNSKNYP